MYPLLIPSVINLYVCCLLPINYHLLHMFINKCYCKLSSRREVLSPEETRNILCAVQLANPHQIAEAAMKISSLRNAIRNVFFKEVDAQCAMLCARKSSQPSVPRVPSECHKNLVEFRWNNILTEMRERAPDVLDFMATVAVPKLKGNDGRQVMPLCTAYGILMNVRCRELSLVQKINAVLLGVGGATKRVSEFLIFCSLAMKSKRYIVQDETLSAEADGRAILPSMNYCSDRRLT